MATSGPAVRRDGRPLWKRAGRRARAAFHRALTVAERFAWRRDPLLPPAHLRIYYYRTASPARFARACEDSRLELVSRGLRPEHRVLDIGCGIGNLAVGLIGYLRGGYDGMDVHQESVDWCQRAITSRHPAFRFHRADLESRAYNPNGGAPAAAYRFPFPDESFDVVFLGSVFTHMLPDGFEQYVGEISRLLRPGGMCVASYFLLNDETRLGVEAGRSFMTFGVAHPSGVCRLHDAASPESAVALDEAFVRRAHERAGLGVQDVRRGGWWNGVSHDQDVVVVVKRKEEGGRRKEEGGRRKIEDRQPSPRLCRIERGGLRRSGLHCHAGREAPGAGTGTGTTRWAPKSQTRSWCRTESGVTAARSSLPRWTGNLGHGHDAGPRSH